MNLASDRTLTAQLKDLIARFIDEHEDGTFFPPELVLANTLGISRVTVRNALKSFLEKGQLVREVPKGTRIRKSSVKHDNDEPLDPLALGMVWGGVPRKTLRFLSYEMLPLQQSFWNRIVWEYSQQNPGVQVEIVPMRADMLSHNISDLLQEKKIDLFLYSPCYTGQLSELARPLPDELRSRMASPEFLSSADSFRNNPAFDYLLPLNVSPLVIAWNTELAARIGWKKVRERLEMEDFLDLIRKAVPLLPDDCYASGHAWDLLAMAGIPVSGSETDQMEKRLRQMEKTLKTPRACIVSSSHTLEEQIRNFSEGRILFLLTTMTIFLAKGEPAVPFEMSPVWPQPGCRNLIMPLNIALSRFTTETAEAVKFMNFLISPQAQKWTALIKRSLPIRRENFYDAMKKEFRYTPEQADSWLRKHKLFISQFERGVNYHRFATFDCRGELEDIAAGRYSAVKAASLLLSKYNAQVKIVKAAVI